MDQFKPENFMDEYDNRLRIHVADARRFITRATNGYDVIVADLFHPARDGAGTLYTREHFRAIRDRLAEDGMFCQWLPLHQMDDATLRVITRTFMEVFPNARAYLLHWSIDVPVLGLFGRDRWPQYTDGLVELRDAALRSHLRRLGIGASNRILGNFVADAQGLEKFAMNAPVNTDDRQIVTYAAPRFSYRRNATPDELLVTVLAIQPPANDYLKARNVYIHGLIKESQGQMTQAVENYIESARISDEFTAGYARCITLASLQAKERPEFARALLERLLEAQPREKLARDLLERLFSDAKK
jgi:spermidine synthase